METLIAKTAAIFAQQFGESPTTLIQAPGRVNLIGEHTDYNDGFVLPCAINYQTVISARRRDDRTINVIAADYHHQRDSFSLDAPILPHPDYQWANYIRGVIKYLQKYCAELPGADFVVSGNIPQGAGLSSSASLEVAVAKMMQVIGDLPLTGSKLALIGQEAENQFVGCNCGIMDQLISALGQAKQALLIDCRSLEIQPVPLPDDMAVMIINSNIKRGLVDSEYNTRRAQCELAAKTLGVAALRDATLSDLAHAASRLDPVVYQRARHIITENARTLKAAQALANSDYALLSQLMAESHASMRDDFAITVPAIDYLVDIIHHVIGDRGGVRMTGGGFGGCVVALVPNALVDAVKQGVADHYQARFAIKETIYLCQASLGASTLEPTSVKARDALSIAMSG